MMEIWWERKRWWDKSEEMESLMWNWEERELVGWMDSSSLYWKCLNCIFWRRRIRLDENILTVNCSRQWEIEKPASSVSPSCLGPDPSPPWLLLKTWCQKRNMELFRWRREKGRRPTESQSPFVSVAYQIQCCHTRLDLRLLKRPKCHTVAISVSPNLLSSNSDLHTVR